MEIQLRVGGEGIFSSLGACSVFLRGGRIWQDLLNVLLPRVAAQLTNTNLSLVHLPGRLRSQSVSTAACALFPASRREWRGKSERCFDGGEGGGGGGREGGGAECEAGDPDLAKWPSYMENTSRLKGNRTTSEFWQTKITVPAAHIHPSCTARTFSLSAQIPRRQTHSSGEIWRVSEG